VFTIWAVPEQPEIQDAVASWPIPSFATLRGTTLGAKDASVFAGSPPARMVIRDGRMTPIPREEWGFMRAEEQLDAVIHLGPPSAITRAPLPRALCADRAYLEIRLKRIALAGLPPAEADRLKAHCAVP
jgi:hypothetical protein